MSLAEYQLPHSRSSLHTSSCGNCPPSCCNWLYVSHWLSLRQGDDHCDSGSLWREVLPRFLQVSTDLPAANPKLNARVERVPGLVLDDVLSSCRICGLAVHLQYSCSHLDGVQD